MDNDEQIRKDAARIYASLATWQRDIFAQEIQSLWTAENKFTGYPEDFERFWNAYPSHKRTEKEKAYREWERVVRNWKKTAPKSEQTAPGLAPHRYCNSTEEFKDFLIDRAIAYGNSNVGHSVYARTVARWLYFKVFDEGESLWNGKYLGRGSKALGGVQDARNSFKEGSI